LDQSFVLQIILDLKASVSRLDQSISNLHEQSLKHDAKLDLISQDVHTAKRIVAVASWAIMFIIALGGLIWAITHHS